MGAAVNASDDAALSAAGLAARSDFTVGSVQISPSRRLVRGPGGETSLEPRAMQVLVVLADAAGDVVTRETLFRLCWGRAVVGEDSLNHAVALVRRAAREAADGQFAIETIPRTGYRFVVAAGHDASALEPLAPERPPFSLSRRQLAIGAGVAAVGLAAAAYGLTRPSPEARRAAALLAQSDQALRSGLPDSEAQGAGFLEEAVRLRPGDAELWGRLALARCTMAEYAPPDQATAAVATVQDAARRALAVDARQADALAALALLPPYYGDWLAAERRLQSVLAIRPDHLPTLDARAFLRISVGRVTESSLDRVRFSAREPLHVIHQYRLIYAYWFLGRIGDADRAAERALSLWPRHPAVWFARLWTLAFTGRPERALALVDDRAGAPDLPPWMLSPLRAAMLAMTTRRPVDVAAAAEGMVALVSRGPSHAVNAFLVLAGLGEVGRALDVAEAYLLERGPLIAGVRWRPGDASVNDQRRRKSHMLFTPVAAPVRADKRFLPLVTDMGLADYWRRAGVRPDFLK
ncbi:winged helix-turn-helix domain-containing protein [Caulobacter sp. 17J80-11]|uniref:winged helix-turn-helix domain-containing protein n=1 Tax=Caulobacter sp. 17J80-11 TaxID=2763502 RepID=UPI001653B304|nr:winged helix-turn-helix domain-containing protein [Caulobacter sp. 17J80-11]